MTNNNLKLKQELYRFCCKFVEDRRLAIQHTIQDLQEALNSETKSTAGDKHETGRAMLQLEREKVGHQLAEIKKLNSVLAKVNTTKACNTVVLGAVVCTTQANYFISISAGTIAIEGQTFYAISPSTPIAKLLISKQLGDRIDFRNHAFTITNVF
ncbi:3-oxoacyl-ACP synthase [Tamlana fucoidanivorans]|uniref:3-oxoacyl-ACP synthase n=1 Tax=Allotamlana fucoidanivorans TaxID=2583814 RepID=A0A5C4STU7_9FLAO|nr:3-oxoacyl-ACP synthase [Tamlana fucoidanivorans]TNJ47139.1 3-oxoacyl-ACP synthase [Tamlana fucoidanivorans]